MIFSKLLKNKDKGQGTRDKGLKVRKDSDCWSLVTSPWSLVLLLLLIFAIPAAASSIVDPSYIGVGARPLGMGKAYVACAEDGETLFFNPAGLGQVSGVKLTSMYTTLLSDVNYLMLGGVYPNPEGTSAFGIGFISSGVSDINLYDASGTLTGTGNWNDNVLILSYGSEFSEMGGFEGLKVGAALKYYSSGGSGSTSIEAAAGSGFDMDFGILFNPTSWSTVGLNLQNALPVSAGGVITRSTGIQESIASTTKVGLKVAWLGHRDKAIVDSDQELNIALDFDYPNLQTGVNTAMHAGVEYWPIQALALRAGLDQDPSPDGIVSNMTAGVGIKVGGVEFDYAYHPYSGLADDTTHFFSISYVGDEIPAGSPLIVIFEPEDKLVMYENEIIVSGELQNANLNRTEIKINGINAFVDKDGRFTHTVPVEKVGKKLVVVEARDINKDEVVATNERRIIKLTSFADVGAGYWAKDPIEQTSTVGLVEGYPDGTFKPERTLTRAELATLLVRASGVAMVDASQQSFKDVSEDHWARDYIATAQFHGYVEGYPDGTFKPSRMITKAEGIAVAARIDQLPLDDFVAVDPYEDVSHKYWAAKYIFAARNAGVLDYITGEKLGPKDGLSRAEAVTMLSKTNFAGTKVKELMSWVTGFKRELDLPETQETTSLTPYVARALANN